MTMVDILMNLVRGAQHQVQPPCELLAQMEGMAERNQKRIDAIKKEMGPKWILHPSHMKSRLDEPRPV